MIFINVRFVVKPDAAPTFLEDVSWFTEASRAEEGNIFFDWYKDPEEENKFILVEAYQDGAAKAHVNSEHFQRARGEMPGYLVETPTIINTLIEGKTEWDEMAEFKVE